MRVRKELLENYNVHTIVSLPKGVFTATGKTPVKTDLLFFDKTGPTKEIWYYEIQPPEGMKNFTKTRPMTDEDWQDCYEKWKNREVSDNSWIVKIDEIDKETYELTPRNPNKVKKKEYRPAREILEDLLREEEEIMSTLEELKGVLR